MPHWTATGVLVACLLPIIGVAAPMLISKDET